MIEDIERLAVKVDSRSTAAIVIDMQNDFCRRAGAFGQLNPDLDFVAIAEMVPRLSRFLACCRQAGVPIIFVRAVYNSHDNRYLSRNWIEQAQRRRAGLYTTTPVCGEGDWGAEIIEELAPKPNDAIIVKHRYSAFINTPLAGYLKECNIKTIIATGVATGGCVAATVQDGFMLDFTVVVVEDCVADSFGREVHDFALRHLDLLYGEVRSASDIDAAWRWGLSSAGDE